MEHATSGARAAEDDQTAARNMKRATVEEELRKNPQLKQRDIDDVREWVGTQSHLPEITDLTLVLFLHCSLYNIDIAKRTLLKFYTFQYNTQHIFLGRDPCKEEIRTIAKTIGLVILDGLDKNGNIVLFQRLLDTNPANYHMDMSLKLSHMLTTIWQLENGTCKGTILVYDQRGFGLSHMTRGSISSMMNMSTYVQECAPINVVEIHVIHTNAMIDAILAIFKRFIKASLYNMICTYKEEDMHSFYEKVPKEILPHEYGGNQLSIEELSEASYRKMVEYRNFFMENDEKIAEAAAIYKSKSPGVLRTMGSWVGL